MELYGSLVANEGSGGGGGGTTDVPIKSISVNGSGVAPVNKNVNIDVPTKTSELQNDSNFASTSDIPTKTSQLENDSNFVTESDLTAKNYADKNYVGEQIAQSEHLKREIVTVLPEPSEADDHTIYMLKDDSVQGNDKYKEYMLIDGVVQCVGDTSVDLTDYAKTSDVNASISALQKSKADLSVLNEHTDNTDIHVTTEEKTTWGTVTNKVDKEEGKVLSSNDYTSEEKTKLSNIGTSQGRNIIPYPLANRVTNGITYTVQSDGSVLANGTASADNNAYYNFAYKTLKLDSTSYTLSCEGLPKSVYVYVYDETIGKAVANISNTPVTKTFVGDSTHVYSLSINVGKGTSVSDLAIKPMLEVGKIAHAYEPISESNVNIKYEVDKKADKSETTVNMLKPTLQKETVSGVTCTNNVDGTYTLNGTATGYKAFVLTELHNNIGRFAGCKIVGLPRGTDTNNIDLSVSYRYENGDESHGNNLGDIVDNAKDTDKSVKVLLIVRNAQTISNMIVKPMLTTNLNATYDDFVPYTGEGKTLSHNVAEIKKDLGDLTFSASGTTLSITDGTHTWTLEANK